MAKFLGMLIKDQVEEHLPNYNLLSKTQCGFRIFFSKNDALAYLKETAGQKLDEKKLVTAAFLDLSQAFDLIDLPFLLEKFKHLDFCSSANLDFCSSKKCLKLKPL